MSALAKPAALADNMLNISGISYGSLPAPITIDSEAILVTGDDPGSTNYSVLRGQNGTAPAAHDLGATVTEGWGGGSSVVQRATVVVTHAQTLTLPSLPVVIVAAPGANKLLVPFFGVIYTQPVWNADYSGIDPGAALKVQFTNNSDALMPLWESTGGAVTTILAGGGPDGTIAFFGPTVRGAGSYNGGTFTSNVAGYYSDISNRGLQIYAENNGAGDFSGGNADNHLTVEVLYYVVDLA